MTQPTQTGTYSLGLVGKAGSRSLTLRLPAPQVYFVDELGSRLVVSDHYADGFSSTYQRQ